MKKSILYLVKFTLVLIFILGFGFVNASNNPNVLFKTEKNTLPVNDITTIKVNVDSKGNIVNGIEGKLIYNPQNLILEKVQIGDSFISLWVEKPNTNTPGVVSFAGVIPGGIVLSDSNIFSLIFRAKQNSQNNITIEDFSLLVNDGSGSSLQSEIIPLSINISGDPLKESPSVDNVDNFIPNKFKIKRAKDESLFDNQWFIVFNTQDKESGIKNYTVCEGLKSRCVDANSPYLLKNQTPFYYIKVFAYDDFGNSRKSILFSKTYYVVLVLILLIVGFFIKKLLKKNK